MRRCMIWVVAAAGAAAPALAGDVSFYAQGPNAADAFASTSDPTAIFAFQAADNFAVAQDTLITKIHWWGNSDEFNLPGLENFTHFTVRLFADDGGLPGGTVMSQTLTTAQTNPVDTGLTSFAGTDVYRQELEFEAPLFLNAGAYFISVTASGYIDNQGAIWYWQKGNGGDGDLVFDNYDGGGWRPFGPAFDTAFELFTVPSPGVPALLGVGVLAWSRRRRGH